MWCKKEKGSQRTALRKERLGREAAPPRRSQSTHKLNDIKTIRGDYGCICLECFGKLGPVFDRMKKVGFCLYHCRCRWKNEVDLSVVT